MFVQRDTINIQNHRDKLQWTPADLSNITASFISQMTYDFHFDGGDGVLFSVEIVFCRS